MTLLQSSAQLQHQNVAFIDRRNILLKAVNGWQLAKMKKSIPDMSLP